MFKSKGKRIARATIAETTFLFLFFIAFLVAGILIYKDFGVSWDEPIQRIIGLKSLSYVLGQDRSLLTFYNRFYGPVYELLLLGLELAVHPAQTRDIFFARHLFTFLTFYLGCIFFYLLGRNFFKKSPTALLGTVALVLSPRIFENAFYNSKDIPSLVAFIIGFYLLFRYIDHKKPALLALLAVVSAFATTIRVSGLLIPALMFAAIARVLFDPALPWSKKISTFFSELVMFLVPFVLFTIAFWPILWSDPLGSFIQAVREVSRFNWSHPILFMGQRYPSTGLPPTYVPVWILISTPLFYTALLLLGAVYLFIDRTFSPTRLLRENEPLKRAFLAAWLVCPILAVIVFKSVLYDSWRHLFFIYPAFILLAFYGLERCISWLNGKFGRYNPATLGLFLLLGATYLSVILFMVRVHPYEQLYFNRLAGSSLAEIRDRFELDYWGLSNRKGLEYIAQHDSAQRVPYIFDADPASYTFILPDADKMRLDPIFDPGQAKYFIGNYRYTSVYPYPNEVYFVQVEGVKILSVFQLK